MSAAEFAASLALGIASVILPIALFIGFVAVCVAAARWWIARSEPKENDQKRDR